MTLPVFKHSDSSRNSLVSIDQENDYSSRTPQDDVAAVQLRPRDLVRAVRARLWVVIASVFFAALAAAYVVTGATPRYDAYAQMLLGEQGLSTRNAFDLVEAQSLTNSVIEGELAVLRSNALLFRVANKLELWDVPEFNPDLLPQDEPNAILAAITGVLRSLLPGGAPQVTPDEGAQQSAINLAASAGSRQIGDLDSIVSELRKNISVRQQGTSFVVQVQVQAQDPETAAAITNTLMDEYIAFLSDKRFAAAQRFARWLENRVADLAVTLETSERDVFAFRATMEADADNRDRLEHQMRELTTRLVTQRSELSEVTAIYEKAREMEQREGPIAAANLMTVDEFSLYLGQLGELRRREASMVISYGETSAQTTSIQRAIEKTEADIEVEFWREMSRLENRAAVLTVVVDSLEQGLSDLSKLMLAQSGDEIELNQLQRIAEANQRVYQEFLDRLKETNEIQNLQTPDADIISYASPPLAPAFPRKKLSVILAGTGGLFIGLALVFLMDKAPYRITTPEQLSQAAGLSVYGQTPRLPTLKAKDIAAVSSQFPGSRTGQTFLQLAGNINIGKGDPERQSIAVGGMSSGGDKSCTALLLGWAQGHLGHRCVVVDLDTKAAALSQALDHPASGGGLADVLYANRPLEDALVDLPDLGLTFLPIAPLGTDPYVIFRSVTFQTIAAALSKSFDTVIFDLPASADMGETLSFLGDADFGLYVVRAGQSSRDDFADDMAQGQRTGLRNLGLVLTGAKSA